MDNVAGAVDVPLSLFSGANTELAPSDLPEGVSPDNQDAAYLPGSAFQRPGLHRWYDEQPNPFVYATKYVQQNEQALNLSFDSGGILYKETSTGAPSQIISGLAKNARCQSVTVDGVEYIAISDALHGAEVPLQYNGTNVDRVSQDGPASPVAVVDATLAFSIVASPNGLFPAQAYSPILLSQTGNVVTISKGVSNLDFTAFQVGDSITISGSVAGYNGTFTLTTVDVGNAFMQFVMQATGLVPDTGTVTTNLVKVVTTANHSFVAGESVLIAGAGVAGYNGTWQVRSLTLTDGTTSPTKFLIYIPASSGFAASGGGTVALAGLITPGIHKCVCMFLTRTGYLTAPTVPTSWNAAGNLSAFVGNLPIGPSNVVARVLAFTGAGGGNYFTLTSGSVTPNPGGSPIIISSLLIPNNTATSVVVSFSDDAIFAGQAIDIPGNNLFAQVPLTPVLGFFDYASRLAAYGLDNNVKNFLNMGFDGGYSTGVNNPSGWTKVTNGGSLVDTGLGFQWKIDGSHGTISNPGWIQQDAYKDYYGIDILKPLTKYTFKAKMSQTTATDNIYIEFYSATSGVLARAIINPTTLTATPAFVTANFSQATPAVIPTDTVLRIYPSTSFGFQIVTLDEIEIIYTAQPYNDTQFLFSYVNNFEAFDAVTGYLGATDDSTPLKAPFVLKDTMSFLTTVGLHQTQDNGTGEPSTWTVNEHNRTTGGMSFKCVTSGEDWAIFGSSNGLRIFDGGNSYKLSQEIQTWWEQNLPQYQKYTWIKNDPQSRRIYIGISVNTVNDKILVLDYRELDTDTQIAGAAPIHISFTGKMISSDLARKWSKWNVAGFYGNFIAKSDGSDVFVIAGQAPDGGGNLWWFDPAKYTDDDFGRIGAGTGNYYNTYFFVNHEAEQALQVGSHRKLFAYLAAFMSGVGTVTFTPLADSLSNTWSATPAYQLTASPSYDLEWGLNVLAERCAFKIQVQPITDTQNNAYTNGTDTYWSINKMVVSMKPSPWDMVRGAI